MSVAILLSARRRPRPRLALLLLTLLLIAASLVHLGLGARWIAPQTVLQALLEYDPRNFEQRIIIDLRLVRLAGDLAGLNWSTLQTALVPALIGLGVALLIAPRLNVLALGDKVALGLGVNLVQTRLLGLLAIALLCGAAVAVAGPIGFVGLVVPHVVRRLVTEDIRLALPLAAPVGALALVLADIAARTLVAPQELATGAMTALVGAPLFIFIAARFFK
ncbi:FecCD family ABC transporter permease [Klebsiella pneumoniae]|uniref:FecCD family ABC transporter permease n=1 Tax=Klebsiella pneumoniae TaxID=573 RepID=UPI0039877739